MIMTIIMSNDNIDFKQRWVSNDIKGDRKYVDEAISANVGTSNAHFKQYQCPNFIKKNMHMRRVFHLLYILVLQTM